MDQSADWFLNTFTESINQYCSYHKTISVLCKMLLNLKNNNNNLFNSLCIGLDWVAHIDPNSYQCSLRFGLNYEQDGIVIYRLFIREL